MTAIYDSPQLTEKAKVISPLVWQTYAVPPVGEAVRKLRNEKRPRVNLLDLAAKTRLNKGTLSRLERGEIDPKYSTLSKIADALDVSIAYLVATEDEQRKLLGLNSPVTLVRTNRDLDIPKGNGDDPAATRIRELEARVQQQELSIQELRDLLKKLSRVALKRAETRPASPTKAGGSKPRRRDD